MRSAAARVAMRRGSSMTMDRAPSQEAPSSAGGTSVVLPAPGGAWSTSDRCVASAVRTVSRTDSIGSVDVLEGMKLGCGGLVSGRGMTRWPETSLRDDQLLTMIRNFEGSQKRSG